MNEQIRIGRLKGIGEKTEKLFEKIHVRTVFDLLHYFPREYAIYEKPVSIAQAPEGKIVTVEGVLNGSVQLAGTKTMQITTAHIRDLTGSLRVVWFRMPYLRNVLRGGPIILRGKIQKKNGGRVMEHPEVFYPPEKYEQKCGSLQPVYALTEGLTNNLLVRTMRQAVEYSGTIQDILPREACEAYGFMPLKEALFQMHFPQDRECFQKARARFVFEEFFIFIMALSRLKQKTKLQENPWTFRQTDLIDELIGKLPYELTNAQKKVLQEILVDMTGDTVMCRLVQGDVGSGKTILAFLSMFFAGMSGCQSAMMAPTEVLARQHYENLCQMLTDYDIPLQARLLTGSMSAGEKNEAYTQIREGTVQLVIGTHALIQEKVEFSDLALVITDEQHRFGVQQRENLSKKGRKPHILVMSATPIPRTLAMILYGDLSISVVDELPKNRLPIKNCVVGSSYRPTAYQFIRKQVEAGRQCYVICPMVEASEFLDGENVIDYTKMLKEELGETITVECLHGRMKQQQKDDIMNRFAEQKIQVLVSTTVIEVGIDVPNATVIMIENAERFGLAQLHQLRGRVGRGQHQSYCIFMSTSASKETQERLKVLNRSNDGFFIAGQDLKLRGPGDLFGIRQSGLLDFKLGDIYQDADLLQKADEYVKKIMKNDPGLEQPEYRNLKIYIDHYIRQMRDRM